MNLLDVVSRNLNPEPWVEGEKIPWHDPAFSSRMLQEHLTQAHDLASRKSDAIEAHVGWIHQTLLGGKPTNILDLGCGPGLYTSRLARLGHTCRGIDYGRLPLLMPKHKLNGRRSLVPTCKTTFAGLPMATPAI